MVTEEDLSGGGQYISPCLRIIISIYVITVLARCDDSFLCYFLYTLICVHVCHSSYPLLKAMTTELTTNGQCQNTSSPSATTNPILSQQTTTQPLVTNVPVTENTAVSTTVQECENEEELVRVCYYSNWAYWRSGKDKDSFLL